MKKIIINYSLCLLIGISGFSNRLPIAPNDYYIETNYQENIRETNYQTNNKISNQTKTEISTIKETDLYAKAAVLIDADSKRVLYEKNGDQVMPMASTTKIMTCIVILENTSPDEVVQVSQYASSMPDVQLNIKEGEQYYVKDLLYSLMLESHNDVAVALAEHVGGTVEGFAALMNQKAKEIGSNNTYFITPNGLDATDETGTHSTTAIDLSRIMAYCIMESPKKEEFLEITRTNSYSFSSVKGSPSFSCSNRNAFLSMMDGALSGKTGFTNDAGYCYVGALERDGKTFVVALLACGWPNNKTYKWSDTKKIMKYGIENYEFRSFADIELDQGELAPILVNDGQTEKIGEVKNVGVKIQKNAQDEIDTINKGGLLMNQEEEIDIIYKIKDDITAPVKEGDIVGSIQYMMDGEVWKENNVIITSSVERINLKWCFEQVTKIFLLE